MATTYTTNYNLGKQENHADKFDMDVITDNADKIDAALTGLQSGIDGKQDALSSAQLAAVNSGITSTDVAQIGLNKNNILLLTQYGGGRNVLSASQVTTSSSVINIETIPAGTYKFHCDTDAPSNWALKFRNASNTDIYVVESSGSMGPNSAITVTLTEDVVKISPWWQGSSSGLKNMYLCRESDWTTPYIYQSYAMSNAELTKLSKWNYTETRYTNTGTSDYENTGISFTAPANQSIEFYAYDRKDGAYLDKILVCDSLTTLGNTTVVSASSIIDGFTDAQYWTLQTTGIVPTFNTDVTYYVWVKRKSTGSNLVGLAWRYLSQ